MANSCKYNGVGPYWCLLALFFQSTIVFTHAIYKNRLRQNLIQVDATQTGFQPINVATDTLPTHGLVPKKSISNTFPSRDNESILSLQWVEPSWYIGKIMAGSEPQEAFDALFDTGSAYTWVPAAECESCGMHRRLTAHPSRQFLSGDVQLPRMVSRSVAQPELMELQFGSGSLTFSEAPKTICLTPFLCVHNQTIGLVINEDENVFGPLPFDAIVGLGLSGLTIHKRESFVNNWLEQILQTENRELYNVTKNNTLELANEQFAAMRYHLPVDHTRDTAFIGFQVLSKRNPARWLSGVSRSYWAVALEDVSVMGIRLNLCIMKPNSHCVAVIDTGTPDILGSQTDIKLLRQLTGLTTCTGRQNFNPFTFHFPQSNGMVQEVLVTFEKLFPSVMTSNDTDVSCDGGLRAASSLAGHEYDLQTDWILGNAFLRGMDTYFYIQQNAIELLPHHVNRAD